jgi:Spy/CpxP family protein refolding chaperone
VSKLEAISQKLEQKEQPIMEKMRAARGNGGRPGELTEQQRNEMRETMDKLRDDHKDALEDARDVLTKEQAQKLESLRPERRERERSR